MYMGAVPNDKIILFEGVMNYTVLISKSIQLIEIYQCFCDSYFKFVKKSTILINLHIQFISNLINLS